MHNFFIACIGVILTLTLIFLGRIFTTKGFFDRFIAILIISTNIVLLLLLVGFVDGRGDMYVDIAVSYAVLGFISSLIIAKFLDSAINENENMDETGKGGGNNGN